MIHENIELTGSFTISGSFNLPNHISSASISDLRTGSIYNDTTDNVVKVYNGSSWVTVGEQAIVIPPYDIEYLVVAGGGGAGYDVGGGGGAGGLLTDIFTTDINLVYTVSIGSGGGSSQTVSVRGGSGGNSTLSGGTINTLTAIGGGGGGSYNSPSTANGLDGGSGGGGGNSNGAAGSGTFGQGNNGGPSAPTSWGSGGGGGAGGIGATGISGQNVLGGLGASSDITGVSTLYAGGGYGNLDGGTVQPTGQNYAGTVLGVYGYGANGTGAPNANPYNGNSGVVILRMPTTRYSGTTTGSPTVTTDGSDTILKFTQSGTYTA
jgi:hypothetical protein